MVTTNKAPDRFRGLLSAHDVAIVISPSPFAGTQSMWIRCPGLRCLGVAWAETPDIVSANGAGLPPCGPNGQRDKSGHLRDMDGDFRTQFVRDPAALKHYPALVLNADYRPLSYYPLSLWPWQEAIKASVLDRVQIVAEYDEVVHSQRQVRGRQGGRRVGRPVAAGSDGRGGGRQACWRAAGPADPGPGPGPVGS